MHKKITMVVLGLGALGFASSSVIAQGKISGFTQGQYELTKSCKKGYVKNKNKKCVKLVCDKNHYLNKAKTKCLPKRTYPGGSPKNF